jgi:hypothetical protein
MHISSTSTFSFENIDIKKENTFYVSLGLSGGLKVKRSKVMCAGIISVFLLTIFIGIQYSGAVASSDIPGFSENGEIQSNATLIVGESESVRLSNLSISGNLSSAPIVIRIIVAGELQITGSINCVNALVSINNTGSLVMDHAVFMLTGNGSLSFSNKGNWTIDDVNLNTYGGFTYLSNSGILTAHNLYMKDQNDGTFLMNNGTATFSETTLVANGATGAFHLTNQGIMELSHNVWDVNYGGTIDMNSQYGVLTVTDSTFDVSGWSHGQQSTINILDGNTTWVSLAVVNNNGQMNYETNREVQMQECSFTTLSNGSIQLANNGELTMVQSLFKGSGSTNINNRGIFTLSRSEYNVSGIFNLQNYATLSAVDWAVRTTGPGQVLLMNSGTLTFNVSFIDGVTSTELTKITETGKQFPQLSGGLISVTNYGIISTTTPAQGMETDFLVILIIVLLCLVFLVLFLLLWRWRKKK